jgi:hypothetical protein
MIFGFVSRSETCARRRRSARRDERAGASTTAGEQLLIPTAGTAPLNQWWRRRPGKREQLQPAGREGTMRATGRRRTIGQPVQLAAGSRARAPNRGGRAAAACQLALALN